MLNSRCKFITFGRNGIHKMLKRCMTLSRYRTSKAINDQYVAKSIESKNKCSLGESTGNKKNNNQFSQRIVFSGIQPTGPLHLGNYFGAIKKWETLQYLNIPCIYSIVDLHSITLPQNPQRLRTNIQVVTACLLASGIDPDKSILFLQSQVPQHTELAWILGCSLTMARLGQLPQFKEKSSSLKEIPLGLYIYPVLQSADILLYKATEVPVGEDQFPHIQLAQHLARSFNNKFGYLFPHPKPSIQETAASRLKSLRQPDKKMSKSEADPKGRIELTDPPDAVREKIMKAVTDFTSAVTFSPEERPGVSNLINIHNLFTGLTPEEICEQSMCLETAQYKLVLAEIVIEKLKPLQKRIDNILKEPQHIQYVLQKGAEKATEIAISTMTQVKKLLGML